MEAGTLRHLHMQRYRRPGTDEQRTAHVHAAVRVGKGYREADVVLRYSDEGLVLQHREPDALLRQTV